MITIYKWQHQMLAWFKATSPIQWLCHSFWGQQMVCCSEKYSLIVMNIDKYCTTEKLRTTVKHWEPCNNNNNTVWKTEQQTLNNLRHSLWSYILRYSSQNWAFWWTPAERQQPVSMNWEGEKCSTSPCVSVRLYQSDSVSGSLPYTRLAEMCQAKHSLS